MHFQSDEIMEKISFFEYEMKMAKFTNEDFLSILDIGIAVAGEKDRNKLLDMIIDKGMELTCCDAGTLYILKDNIFIFILYN